MAAAILTAERLREVLDYNAETGVFVWKKHIGRSKAGHVAGCLNSASGYLVTGLNGRIYTNHRLAWLYVNSKWPSGQIDHINGCRSDNRICNLRDVTGTVNSQNIRRARGNSICGLLGVSLNGSRWSAKIQVNGARIYIGTFDTPEEAHAAYIEAKRRLHSGCTL